MIPKILKDNKLSVGKGSHQLVGQIVMVPQGEQSRLIVDNLGKSEKFDRLKAPGAQLNL